MHNAPPTLSTLLASDTIAARVEELGREISNDYEGSDLLLIGALRGAYVFLADLARAIETPVTIDFVGAKSYVGTESSGAPELTRELLAPARGKDVLLVEDILDTGRTADMLLNYIREFDPASVDMVTLLDKPSRRLPEYPFEPRYSGFTIDDQFVVGYGLDYEERYRNLRDIAILQLPDDQAPQ